jgi:hypothetical protein
MKTWEEDTPVVDGRQIAPMERQLQGRPPGPLGGQEFVPI